MGNAGDPDVRTAQTAAALRANDDPRNADARDDPIDRSRIGGAQATGLAGAGDACSQPSRPIASGANPAGARAWVAPMITTRNTAVRTTSIRNAAASVYPPGDNAP